MRAICFFLFGGFRKTNSIAFLLPNCTTVSWHADSLVLQPPHETHENGGEIVSEGMLSRIFCSIKVTPSFLDLMANLHIQSDIIQVYANLE